MSKSDVMLFKSYCPDKNTHARTRWITLPGRIEYTALTPGLRHLALTVVTDRLTDQ